MQENKSAEGFPFENTILEWNVEIPVDRWWRKRHNVAFNSSIHREISFIDMYWEFLEDSLYDRVEKEMRRKKDDPYIPNTHNFVKRRLVSQEELSEEDFDNIEI